MSERKPDAVSRAIRRWAEAESSSVPAERYRAREALSAALPPDSFGTLGEFYDFLECGVQDRSTIDEMCSTLRERLRDRSRSPGRFMGVSIPLSAPFPDRPFDHRIGGPERLRIINDDPGDAVMMRCTVPAHEALVRSEITLKQIVGALFAIELAQWHPRRSPTYMGKGPLRGAEGLFSRDIALRASEIETEEHDPDEFNDGSREGAFEARELARRVLAHEMRILVGQPPPLEVVR